MIFFVERFVLFLAVFVLTFQGVLPALRGLPLFSAFRRGSRIDREIADARERKLEAEKKLELAHLESEISDMQDRASHPTAQETETEENNTKETK